MIKDQLEERHANRLEWIVICLIVSQVMIKLVWDITIKDILGYFPQVCLPPIRLPHRFGGNDLPSVLPATSPSSRLTNAALQLWTSPLSK